jgi:hypothetical protein
VSRPSETRGGLSRDRREDVVAGLLAVTASLGAHPAVLIVGGVVLALVAAQTASLGTRLEGGPRHLRLEGRLTGEDPTRGIAHVSAVEVEPDAAGEGLGVVLAEAGVRASCATLSTVEAGLYARNERPGVHGSGARVGLQHLLGVGHEASFLSRTPSRYPPFGFS